MLEFHLSQSQGIATMMGTEATRQQSLNFGCIVEDKTTHRFISVIVRRHYDLGQQGLTLHCYEVKSLFVKKKIISVQTN